MYFSISLFRDKISFFCFRFLQSLSMNGNGKDGSYFSEGVVRDGVELDSLST